MPLSAVDFFIEQPTAINENSQIVVMSDKAGFLMRQHGGALIYKLYSKDAVLEAWAKMRAEKEKVIVDLFDPENELIGTIVEDWSAPYASFTLFSADSQEIGKGEQDFWGITFVLTDFNDKPLVYMAGSFSNLNYEVEILGQIDDRLIRFFLPFSLDAQTLHKRLCK